MAGWEKGGGVGGQGLQRNAVFFRAERPWWFGVVSPCLGDGGGAAVPGVLYCIHGPIRGRDGGQPGGRGGGEGGVGPWLILGGGGLAGSGDTMPPAGVGYAKLAAAKLAA